MLGMFNLLPFLKGWEYKNHAVGGDNIRRGAPPVELPVSELGWLLAIVVSSTDCYGTLNIKWQGADLSTQEINISAENTKQIGSTMQDPLGWVQRYYRPNPNSTAGIFFSSLYTGGAQGSAWPYVPTVIMSVHLPEESTQESATIIGGATTIAITNQKLFLKSLRSLLGIKGKIDPALLTIGPVAMMEDSE